MDSIVWALPCWIKSFDLVVARHCGPPYLDDIHVIPRQIQLPEAFHEIRDEFLLSAGKMRTLRDLAEVVAFTSLPGVHKGAVRRSCRCALVRARGGKEVMPGHACGVRCAPFRRQKSNIN